MNFWVVVPSLSSGMTTPPTPIRVHVVVGGFPRGSAAGHDIDYARLRILQLLQENARAMASVSGDFKDVESWLPKSDLLVTYVAGPFPDEPPDPAGSQSGSMRWALAGTARHERRAGRADARWKPRPHDVERPATTKSSVPSS